MAKCVHNVMVQKERVMEPFLRNGHIVGIPDYSTKLKDLPEGKMYHTLQYGKGLMGSHASQLSQKERWLIIEYIKTLQGNDVESTETENND